MLTCELLLSSFSFLLGSVLLLSVSAAFPPPPPASQFRERLVAFYQQFNPAKLQDPTFSIDQVLASYKGREQQLFAELEKKYLGTQTASSSPPPYLSSADASPRKQRYPDTSSPPPCFNRPNLCTRKRKTKTIISGDNFNSQR